MNDAKRALQLSDADIAEIKRMARGKLGEYRKTNDVIGNQIFSILGLNARVFFYPLGVSEPWGIAYMPGMERFRTNKPFVVINSSIPVDAQVFAAAHELYHIWFDSAPATESIIVESIETNRETGIPELKANRFAAEFLIDEVLLKREMDIYSIHSGKVSVKDILRLSSLFIVPYRTIVKRLSEIEAINNADREYYLGISGDEINILRTKYSLQIPLADNRISIDNLVELAVKAYAQKKITYERLQYLLSISELAPQDVGIQAPAESIPPSDDELDGIMEE